jgi:hypothetical protein
MKTGDLVRCTKTPSPDTCWPMSIGIVEYVGSDKEGHYIKVYYPNDTMSTAWHRREDLELVSAA